MAEITIGDRREEGKPVLTGLTWEGFGFSPETLAYLRQHHSSPGRLNEKIIGLKYAEVLFVLGQKAIDILPQELEGRFQSQPNLSPRELLVQNWPAYFPNKQSLPKILDQYPGLKNPAGTIEKHPQLAGLDIQRVITALTDAGLKNPAGAIEKFPQLASLDIQRVKRKIRLCSRLHKLYGIFGQEPLSDDLTQEKSVEIIEDFPPYLGYSLPRIFFYLRLARDFGVKDQRTYLRLITKNPFLIFWQLANNQDISFSPSDLRQIISRADQMLRDKSKSEKAAMYKEAKRSFENTMVALTPKSPLFKLAKVLTKMQK